MTGLGRFRLERRPDSLPVALRQLSDRLVTLRRAVRAAEWDAVLRPRWTRWAQGVRICYYSPISRPRARRRSGSTWSALRPSPRHSGKLAARDDRAAIVANARAQLTATDPALAQRLSGVLDRIEAGETSFPSVSTAGVDTIALSPTEVPSDLAIAAISRGLRGLAHHAFNTVTGPLSDLGTALAISEEFTILLDHRESLLREAQTRLFDAVKADRSREVLAGEAQQPGATVEHFVIGFAAAEARLARVAGALRDAGRGTDAENVGAQMAAAGLFGREAFASHAAAVALGFELRKFRPSAIGRRVLDLDEGVVFDGTLPSGPRTALADLSSTPDGTLVQIRGFATAFKQRRSADGKLLSELTLLDPSSGSSATAVGVFIHFPHAGVTERLRGRPRVRSNELTAARWRLGCRDRRPAARGAGQALLADAAVRARGAMGRDVAQWTARSLVPGPSWRSRRRVHGCEPGGRRIGVHAVRARQEIGVWPTFAKKSSKIGRTILRNGGPSAPILKNS